MSDKTAAISREGCARYSVRVSGTRRGLFREEQANGSGNTGIIPVFFGIEEDGDFLLYRKHYTI